MGLAISGLTLANGLRVVLVRDPQAAELQVTMRYRVGGIDDPRDHRGMAHLVEHLMFQQVLGSQSLFAHLQAITSYFNAYTSLDATTYVARATPTRLATLLSIEAIRVGFRCAGLADATFLREREVVVNEVTQRDEATEILAALSAASYPVGHPYRESVAGTVDSVGTITRDQACAFADAHYAPGNAVLVISGNVTVPEVEAALGKFLGRVARREFVPPPEVEPAAQSQPVEIAAPLDDDAVLLAWPLPRDPQLRAQFRAVASVAAQTVDAEIRGRTAVLGLGDGGAPMFGILVFPASGESVKDVLDGARRGLDALPGVFGKHQIREFGEIMYDRVQQTAIHELFTSLEDGGGRDARLAAFVLAGQDPNASLAAEFQGLRDMDRAAAASVARDHLGFTHASVATLKAAAGKKRGRPTRLTPAIDDPGLRRDPPDPADAHRPVASPEGSPQAAPAAPGLVGMTMRTLPNGLHVVLLPVTSVPTVEIRVVFGAGTADEPAGKRGAALVAAHALTWDFRYLNDLLLFAAAGGTNQVDVGTDQTSFAAQGVDMHLDMLLAGLRRWLRDGTYDDADAVVDAMRNQTKIVSDERALTDAWRTAIYGAGHPYVAAGLVRRASPTLTIDDVERFRAAHFTPDNATLVIAGRFDPALADRWIDYLFADWEGHAEPRTARRASLQPASLAKLEELTQVHLTVAIPAVAGTRAQQLVIAEMLAEVASDVRQRQGASYGVAAQLDEARLASSYVIAGSIDAPRAAAAVELLRDGIAALHTDPDAAARAFVSARGHVLAKLGATTGSAEALASGVTREVELQRAPRSALQTAGAVRQLTIEDLGTALADLELARAAVLMRGPGPEVQAAFDVLGRTPTQIHADTTEQDGDDAPAAVTTAVKARERPQFRMSDLEDPLTLQGPPRSLALMLSAGHATARLIGSDTSGFMVAGDLGFRFSATNAVGLHLAIGSSTGTYTIDVSPVEHPLELVPVDVALFAQMTLYDRLWVAAFAGLHLDRVIKDTTEWHAGIGLGLEGGVDVLRFGRHRFGVIGSLTGGLISQTGYGGFLIGVAYRR
jgi:zinc protease